MIVVKKKYLTDFVPFAIVLACLLFAPSEVLSVDYQLYDSPFPSENYNGPATNCTLYPGAGLLDPASATTVMKRGLYPMPFLFVSREPHELYVIGGAGQAETYIDKVCPFTLNRLKHRELRDGTARFWAPSVAVHANGYIYVTAQNVCYKLDNDINIIGDPYILPITEEDGVYNSMKVFSDGNIVCKGFRTFEPGEGYSVITLLDQNLNPIIAELRLPERSVGRVSVYIHKDVHGNDREYVYFTGETTLIRYEYISGANPPLKLDDGWSYKYRTGTSRIQTAGGVASFIGDNAYFVDNADLELKPVGAIHLFRVNLNDSADAQIFTPFGLPNGCHFNKHLVDPVNDVIVVADTRNSKVGGYRYVGNNEFQTLWVNDYRTAIVASASSSRKQLYISDFKRREGDCIVILDIETGEELRRVATPARGPSLAGFALGYNNDVFWASATCSVRIYNDDADTPELPQVCRTPLSQETRLFPNFPNPFNPETWMPYSLASDAFVSLDIYNLQGIHIRHIDLGYRRAGAYISKSEAAYWDGRNELGEEVSSGVYFYSIRASRGMGDFPHQGYGGFSPSGEFEATRRMTILK